MNQIATMPSANALFDPSAFTQMSKIADTLVISKLLPNHLRGKNIGKGQNRRYEEYQRERQCAIAFLVVNAARMFDTDPFWLAQCSFEVGGKLDFDGKVYAALANARAGLASNLTYRFIGEGDNQRCICSGRFVTDTETREVMTPTFKECSRNPKGEIRDAWRNCDHQQQLSYAASRMWVRRHCPGVLLGLAADTDDFDGPPTAVDEDAYVIEANASRVAGDPPEVEVIKDKIAQATTVDELKEARAMLEAVPDMLGQYRKPLEHQGREKYKELVEPAKNPNPDPPAWKDELAKHEAVLETSNDPDEIDAAWSAIEAIKDLPPAENKRMGDLLNERGREIARGEKR